MALRSLTPTDRATTLADHNGLPHQRIDDCDGVVHVFTASLDHLDAWRALYGGQPTALPVGDGATVWTLTIRAHHLDIHVHALALAIEEPITPTQTAA
ncbi:hypothetical protein [Streptomyces chilikensis]|uniref:Uncharacterized protein n=1 Tax=Streptomyces chilikensis TaxID=1194079 RepID=A0ABV3ERD9_9ACTN